MLFQELYSCKQKHALHQIIKMTVIFRYSRREPRRWLRHCSAASTSSNEILEALYNPPFLRQHQQSESAAATSDDDDSYSPGRNSFVDLLGQLNGHVAARPSVGQSVGPWSFAVGQSDRARATWSPVPSSVPARPGSS